ncbi:MAG: glutamate synthase central domain-containing protein [Dorea sp.]
MAILMKTVKTFMLPMALNGAEADRLPWVLIHRWLYLSDNHQPLFNYFKQLFAQVTNPPIDCHP